MPQNAKLRKSIQGDSRKLRDVSSGDWLIEDLVKLSERQRRAGGSVRRRTDGERAASGCWPDKKGA